METTEKVLPGESGAPAAGSGAAGSAAPAAGPAEDDGGAPPGVGRAERMSGRRVAVPRRTAVLVFEEGPYAGTEARCVFDISLADYFEYQRLAARAENNDAEAFREVAERFGDEVLLEWNLDDDRTGEPLPATGASLLALPVPLVTDLLRAWLDGMTRPAAPLG